MKSSLRKLRGFALHRHDHHRKKREPKNPTAHHDELLQAAQVFFYKLFGIGNRHLIKSFIQGFLPGIALKIFLILLPTILMLMSKFEGYTSLSSLERKSAGKYYIFLLVNVFLGSIMAGTAFKQRNTFIHQSATEIPKTIGVAIPMNATFFITFIMVDGWAGIAGEVLRLKPLIIF